MTSSAYYRHQASILARLAKMTPNPARAAALLLLANERLALANQREPQSAQVPPPPHVLLRNAKVRDLGADLN
jgi:hypothetical protein